MPRIPLIILSFIPTLESSICRAKYLCSVSRIYTLILTLEKQGKARLVVQGKEIEFVRFLVQLVNYVYITLSLSVEIYILILTLRYRRNPA